MNSKDELVLTAKSIVIIPAGFRHAEVVVFEPDAATVEVLQEIERGEWAEFFVEGVFNDEWDTNADRVEKYDTHRSTRLIKPYRAFCDSGKSHTWLVSIIQM